MEGMRRRMMLAVFCAFLVAACSNVTPSLGRGLPRTFGPTPDFDKRIQERFPVGSEESKLLAELHGLAFTSDLASASTRCKRPTADREVPEEIVGKRSLAACSRLSTTDVP